MSVITIVLALLVAAELLFIFYLETIATTSPHTARTFSMTIDELSRPSVSTLFKNQGVYNGILAILLLVAALVIPSKTAVIALSASMAAVAAYGVPPATPRFSSSRAFSPQSAW